jgi:hypothetical protein
MSGSALSLRSGYYKKKGKYRLVPCGNSPDPDEPLFCGEEGGI